MEEREALIPVALRDRDHEPQVRLDHFLLRAMIAALDALCQLDLLGGGQQLDLADVLQEELQRVGRELRVYGLLHLFGLRRVEVRCSVRRDVERRDLFVLDYGRDLDVQLDFILELYDVHHDYLVLAHETPSLAGAFPDRMRHCRRRTGRTP